MKRLLSLLLISTTVYGTELECFELDDINREGFANPVYIDLQNQTARYVANSLVAISHSDERVVMWEHHQIGFEWNPDRRATVSLVLNRKTGRLVVSSVSLVHTGDCDSLLLPQVLQCFSSESVL